jgi:nucleotide-binding universal stress UspA family protein
MKIQNILLPTDLSENADLAMRQAVEFAAQHGAKIHVFHAVTVHAADPSMLKERLDEYLDGVEKEVFEDLSQRSEKVRKRGVEVEVTTGRSFMPFDAIMDKVSEVQPELIVMGTHGRSGFSKLMMGSVAEKVVRHAPCHVLTVSNEATVAEGEDGFQRVLVAVDFSDSSKKALEVGSSLVAEGGRLALVHVVSAPIHPSFYAGGITRMFELDPELPDRIRGKLREFYKGDAELVVTEGDVAQDILEAARSQKSEMIVMGTKGLSGLDHLLIGSVAERVLREATVPVLTVK